MDENVKEIEPKTLENIFIEQQSLRTILAHTVNILARQEARHRQTTVALPRNGQITGDEAERGRASATICEIGNDMRRRSLRDGVVNVEESRKLCNMLT